MSDVVPARALVFALISMLLAGCAPLPAPVPPTGAPTGQASAPRAPANTARLADTLPRPAKPTAQPAADPGFSRPPPGLEPVLHELWRTFPGQTGIAVQRIDGDWALARRADDMFPQQSVSKLWVAMAALDAVDRGRIRLDDLVVITPDDLTLFHQPIAERVRAEGAVRLSVAELIEMAMTRSDNSANDALSRHIGGPDAVRDFLDRKRLRAIRYGPGERLLQAGIAGLTWDQSLSRGTAFQAARAKVPLEERRAAMAAYLSDPVDGASPRGVAAALTRLARGELLSAQSTKYLIDVMAGTHSGPNRLKAGFPAGWRIAHKTGTGQDLGGMTAGYNNIGIATAPDDTRYAIVVFLKDTTASVPDRMRLMQAVARAVADHHGR